MTIWTPRTRDYEKETKSCSVLLQEVSQHPLLPETKETGVRNKVMPPKVPLLESKDTQDPMGAFLSDSQGSDPLLDPLGAMSLQTQGFIDPLQDSVDQVEAIEDEGVAEMGENNTVKAAADKRRDEEDIKQQAIEMYRDELTVPWSLKKKQILSEYSVVGSILLNKDAYDPFEGTGIEDGTQTRHLDKYANRLAALERRVINDKKIEITQGQFEGHEETK